MNEGNCEVVLCERGIGGFGNYPRYTLDLSAVPVLKHLTHLPVIVDPSHATGKWRYVEALALAAVAGGAGGLAGVGGLGLIGGSLGMRIRELGLARVIGVDNDYAVTKRAEERGAADETHLELERVRDADVIIIAVPPEQTVNVDDDHI